MSLFLYLRTGATKEEGGLVKDAVLNKIATIERCINRIAEVYEGNRKNLSDLTKQDSIILNIQRACEASIDLAMYLVSERKLSIPKTNLEAFKILQDANIIEENLARNLRHMVKFRNTAVRAQQELDLDILETIFDNYIGDFGGFTKVILQFEK